MEGVMMKNQEKYAVAVRKPDHEIEVKVSEYTGIIRNKKIRNMPILRGVFSFIESLVLGMQTLTYSASFFEDEEVDVYSLDEIQPFKITIEDGVYVLSGSVADSLLDRVNLDDYESLQYFQRALKRAGIIDALREKGIHDGDTVRIGDWEFDFVE